MLNIDLHCHSTISDGLLTPTKLVEHAAKRGVKTLALTDHDDVAGLDEAYSKLSTLRFLYLSYNEYIDVIVTHSTSSVNGGFNKINISRDLVSNGEIKTDR